MSKRVNWFITDQNVTVNYDGQTHIIKRSDALADALIHAIKNGRMDNIPNLVSIAASMQNQSKGNVIVRDGELMVRGVKVPVELARKIQNFIKEGLPYQPLVKFAENLLGNPSYRAVNELFQFLEKNDHPFTESGNFIAYKRVRGDFKDIHSGTFDNSPGTMVEIHRNQVDEDSNRTCSHGLHVANWDYAHTQFASYDPASDIMLEVEVNPGDVVAVPNDYNQSKIRVCRYKVLGIVKTEYSGSSLRVVDPDYVAPEPDGCVECGEFGCNGECEEESYCQDCGANCEAGYDLCVDCENEYESEDFCEDCGDDCEAGNTLCDQCEDDLNETEDRYPFEDEFENE